MRDQSADPGQAPAYLQIADLVSRRIAAGALVEGERLPPERRLAAEMGVAVGTLRRALSVLAERRLIERRHGSGNYVRPLRDAGGVYGFFRLELAGGGGGLPAAEVLAVERRAKPAAAPGFGPSGEAHRIRRLRRLDGAAVALEEIWLDAGWAERLEPGDLDAALYLSYAARLGLRIVRVEDRVGVGRMPDWGRGALTAGAACGHVARIGWAQTGMPAEWSLTWFDADRARYVARMK